VTQDAHVDIRHFDGVDGGMTTTGGAYPARG
jgi:hypothetical protein